ncbi:hypothetical protein GT100_002660 [Salmonella enterica]|nr:hypothetical protein [Salmonella enterica]
MQDYLLESLKLQRIDFFIKLVAASECSDEEKRLAIQWVTALRATSRSWQKGADARRPCAWC